MGKLTYLANIFFGFGITLRICSVFERKNRLGKGEKLHPVNFTRHLNVHLCLEQFLNVPRMHVSQSYSTYTYN